MECDQGNQILWNNKNITIEEKSLYYKEWYQRGIVYIQDLFDDNGISLNFETFSTKLAMRTNSFRNFGVINTIQ